jgi:hypothetical protein
MCSNLAAFQVNATSTYDEFVSVDKNNMPMKKLISFVQKRLVVGYFMIKLHKQGKCFIADYVT